MSEKMTRITIPNEGGGLGLTDYGERSAKDMIADLRAIHEQKLKDAQFVLGLEDHEFQIDIVRGPFVQHHIKTIQQSTKKAR